MSTKDLEGDSVQVGAEQGTWLVACGGVEENEKSFLGEFFGVRRVGGAAAEEAIDGLFVAEEEFVERVGGTFGEGQHEMFVAGRAGGEGGSRRRVVHRGGRETLRV